jgi:hypothetical protein
MLRSRVKEQQGCCPLVVETKTASSGRRVDQPMRRSQPLLSLLGVEQIERLLEGHAILTSLNRTWSALDLRFQ